ncbi:hypothetical protein L202_05515 [Cryptococcus amylolentus CBS 6039]|uniref:Uncharacterized protein n=2 Tax=Cryptococcus amylolentus TaxID=104669 RepID=A0A1E3HKU5_9TREE|nr:hypothetical protein L202_05515 [Cryptococcus amylolentus CBS 6039]ODN76949.1 hypothetical protein L202_05515 [Cryptococcus amylolentus CBS 6039]ODO04834.1 hypothetical protein I350_05444 [Cryptococcus amylolentus CBS 6273]
MASTTYNGPFLPPIHTSFTPLLSSPTGLITSQELHSALDRNPSDSFESLHDLYQVNEEEAEEDWSEDSDQIQVYSTKPLRVRKKKGRSTKVTHVANRRRSTMVSVPRSPVSPKSPVSPRSPTSFDSDSAHAHISRIFLSLPEPSPTMAVPLVTQPNRLAPVTSTDRQSTRSSRSSLHLGLGGSSSYDPICPGPSPPSSPVPSPNKRHFTSPTMYESFERPRKPLPAVPSSPITPSRAPRKAAKLLGVDLPPVMEQEKKKHYAASALKAGRHFRPLPNVDLAEIEKFFGEVPKKPSKSQPGLKTGKKASSSCYKSNSAHGAPEACDRNIGEGQTVKHRGTDGSMWLDVEEEQEFAWLMSEAIAAVPASLPSVDDLSESIGGTFPVERRDRCIDDMNTLYGSDEEDSGKWDMEAFTSILSVPKPKASRASPSSSSSPSKSRPQPPPLVRRANNSNPDSSFMEIATPKRLDFSFDISPARDLNTWSRSGGSRHARSVSSPAPVSPHYEISEPMPLPGYEFSASSSYPALSLDSSAIGAGLDRKMSSSPPRIRNRPPPINLPDPVVNHRLPILTASSPSMTQSDRDRDSVIVTPFVKPRAAPAPHKGSVPAVPPIPLEHIPYRPPMPTTVDSDSVHGWRSRGGKGLAPRNEQREETSTRDLISFFEPVTPVERMGPMYEGGGAGPGAAAGTKGKGWLKRAMKPLKSQSREAGPRVYI